MTAYAARLLIASVTILGFAGAALAESVTVTPAVQKDCEWDYHNFCDRAPCFTQQFGQRNASAS